MAVTILRVVLIDFIRNLRSIEIFLLEKLISIFSPIEPVYCIKDIMILNFMILYFMIFSFIIFYFMIFYLRLRGSSSD